MPTDKPMSYEEFLRRRVREILEDRPITPNPFIRDVRLEDGKLVIEVERPADIAPAEEDGEGSDAGGGRLEENGEGPGRDSGGPGNGAGDTEEGGGGPVGGDEGRLP